MTLIEIFEELNKLDENTKSKKIKDILFGNNKKYVKTFAIISAENPDDKILSDLENKQRSNQFRQAIKELRDKRLESGLYELDKSMKFELDGMHLQYIKLFGSYGELEHSFFIINISYSEAKFLATTFGQKAFWFCKYNEGDYATCNYYEYIDNKKDYECLESSQVIQNAQAFEDYFSQRGNFKFHIWTKLFDENYEFEYRDIIDENALDESVCDSENFTTKHRIRQRIKSYKGV